MEKAEGDRMEKMKGCLVIRLLGGNAYPTREHWYHHCPSQVCILDLKYDGGMQRKWDECERDKEEDNERKTR